MKFEEEKKVLAAIILIGSFVFSIILWYMGFEEDSDFFGIAIISSVISLLTIRYIICKDFHTAAVQKGYEGKKYFWYGFFFGLAGYLLVIALPDKKK